MGTALLTTSTNSLAGALGTNLGTTLGLLGENLCTSNHNLWMNYTVVTTRCSDHRRSGHQWQGQLLRRVKDVSTNTQTGTQVLRQ